MGRKLIDDMVRTIARESRTLAEYARRAEAYNGSLAMPFDDDALARAYRTAKRTDVLKAIDAARTKRLEATAALWGRLANNINTNEED